MAGIVVDAFKSAAANRSFGKTLIAGVEGGQALVEAHVARGLRQSAEQRHDRLVGQIIRKEEVGIGDRGTDGDRDRVGIRLIDDGGGSFQLFDDDRAFFGGDARGGRGGGDQGHDLLIILQVHLVLRLGGREHVVEVASAGEISVFDGGMSEEFGDFVDMGALAGLVQEEQESVESARIVADVANDGMQAGQEFGGVGTEEPIGMAGINFERLVILTEASATFGEQKQGVGVIVDGEEFFGDGTGFEGVANLQIRLEQIAQPFGMRVEIGGFLEILDGVFGIVGFQGGFAAEQQDVAVAGIEDQHPFENIFGSGEGTAGAQGLGSGAKNLPGFFLFSEADVDFGELDAHGHIFRVHFEDLLEKANGLVEVAVFHKIFGDLEILGAGVVEQALLSVEFGEF